MRATTTVRVSKPPERTNASGDGSAVQGGTYRVREGDTLWEVARRSGVSVDALARANRRSQRGVLRAGTVLRVPGR